MTMLFGHTSSLMSLTKSMNVQLEKTPGWAAALVFELYESVSEQPNNFFVRTLFKNSTYVEDFYTLDVPGCGTLCSLEQFIEVLAPMTVQDYKAECSLNNSQTSNSAQLHLPVSDTKNNSKKEKTTELASQNSKGAISSQINKAQTCGKKTKKGKKCSDI